MQTSNNLYADGIGGVETNELKSFYGDDREVLVLMSDGQKGMVQMRIKTTNQSGKGMKI